MKKLISILFVSLTLVLSAFAGGWKSYDLLKSSKLAKFIDQYEMELVEEKPEITVYRSEDCENWIYISQIGKEENGDKDVYYFIYANMGGQFNSCIRYGQLLTPAKPYEYIYGGIDESNTSVSSVPTESSFTTNTYYVWGDPQGIYANLFYIRLVIFNNLYKATEAYNITIPDSVLERYSYFSKWYQENMKDEDLKKNLPKEYKKYIKENPIK